MRAAEGMADSLVAAQGIASFGDPDWTLRLESPRPVGHGVGRHGEQPPGEADFADQRQHRWCGAARPRRQR